MADITEEKINTDKFKYRTMGEVIHKCIRCNGVVFEVEEGVFICPHCGFEWEIL